MAFPSQAKLLQVQLQASALSTEDPLKLKSKFSRRPIMEVAAALTTTTNGMKLPPLNNQKVKQLQSLSMTSVLRKTKRLSMKLSAICAAKKLRMLELLQISRRPSLLPKLMKNQLLFMNWKLVLQDTMQI